MSFHVNFVTVPFSSLCSRVAETIERRLLNPETFSQAVYFRFIPMVDPFARVPPVSPDALHLEEIPREFRDEFTRLMQRIDFLETESIRIWSKHDGRLRRSRSRGAHTRWHDYSLDRGIRYGSN
jgi:hypothetical protein